MKNHLAKKKHFKLKNPMLKTNFIESTSFVRFLAK
jgi:hypothetical protein